MGKKIFSSTTSFSLRLLAFAMWFLIVTGIIGPYIVSSRLLYGFGFYIYGNLGKLVLLSFVALFLMLRNKKIMLPTIKSSWRDSIYLAVALLLMPLFFYLSTILLRFATARSNLLLTILLHLILLTIPLLCLISCLTASLVGFFLKRYWKFLLVGLLCALVYDISIFYIWNLWPFFSNVVLQIMVMVFSITQHPVVVIHPRTLFVRNFAVTIEESCSGIDSMYMLLSLYLLLIGIDWKIINIKKAALFFIPLCIGMFVVNILRVYLLISIGLIFDPKITLQLFHTYLGLVLFFIYFFCFLYFVYPFLKQKNTK